MLPTDLLVDQIVNRVKEVCADGKLAVLDQGTQTLQWPVASLPRDRLRHCDAVRRARQRRYVNQNVAIRRLRIARIIRLIAPQVRIHLAEVQSRSRGRFALLNRLQYLIVELLFDKDDALLITSAQ